MEAVKSRRIVLTGTDRVFLGLVYAFVGLFTLAVLYPLLYVVSCSFSSPGALVAGRVYFLPVEPSLMGYEAVFKTNQVWTGYLNSIVYTAVGTALSVVVTMAAAFPLTRKEYPSRKATTWFYAITMFIGGALIPSYLLVKYLGLMDSMWALILPGLTSAWSIIIARTFIASTIPEEMFEAASADGCNYFMYFFKMVFPLSKAIMAVLALGYATGMWNSYFGALLYITSPEKYPLQLILKNILVSNIVDFTAMDRMPDIKDMMMRKYLSELLKYSLIVVSCVPLMIFYPFIQKYFIKGVMIGSIKG
jgi:multiple sugar transport system permease protein/putative aldouronate transport system permease protein